MLNLFALYLSIASVKNFKTLLPAAAKDVYYRDDIGNISTSHLKVQASPHLTPHLTSPGTSPYTSPDTFTGRHLMPCSR